METQKSRILKHLQSGRSISSFEAYKDFGVTQLGARIFELKEQGYRIKSKNVTGVNRFGYKAHWSEYELEEFELFPEV